MKPLIANAYEEVRQEHGLARKAEEQGAKQNQKDPFDIPQVPNIQTSLIGHLSLFNQHCQQRELSIEWKYCDVLGGTKSTPVWTVDAFVDGEFVGTGQGQTKKTARNEAAKQGLKFLGVVLVSPMRQYEAYVH